MSGPNGLMSARWSCGPFAAEDLWEWPACDCSKAISKRRARFAGSLPSNSGELAEIAAQIEFFDRRFDVAIELYRNLNKANPNGGGSFYGAMSYCSAGAVPNKRSEN